MSSLSAVRLPRLQRLGIQLAPALVACSAWFSVNGGEADAWLMPAREDAGAMMVADRILHALEEQDERYAEHRKAQQERAFSIESVASKLSEYFMS
jgi:hypothetical protein